MKSSQYLIWGALLVTLMACYWVSNEETASSLDTQNLLAERHPRQMKLSTDQASNKPVESRFELRKIDSSQLVDLFAPFPSVPEANPNEVPSASNAMPSNPYIYAGKIAEDGVWTVFLTDNVNNFVVKSGEALQGGWYVKKIQSDMLVLGYRPLNQEVKLDIGATL